jgi:hypothetical protein
MAIENIYKWAIENKVRFETSKGLISTEDLFSLSMERLNEIYVALKRQQKNIAEESLMDEPTNESATLATKIEIVQDVYNTKKAKKEASVAAAEAKQKKQKIMEILEAKKDQALQNMSVEELEAMLKD